MHMVQQLVQFMTMFEQTEEARLNGIEVNHHCKILVKSPKKLKTCYKNDGRANDTYKTLVSKCVSLPPKKHNTVQSQSQSKLQFPKIKRSKVSV